MKKPIVKLHGTERIRGIVRSPLTGDVIKRCACGRPEYFGGQCFKCVQSVPLPQAKETE